MSKELSQVWMYTLYVCVFVCACVCVCLSVCDKLMKDGILTFQRCISLPLLKRHIQSTMLASDRAASLAPHHAIDMVSHLTIPLSVVINHAHTLHTAYLSDIFSWCPLYRIWCLWRIYSEKGKKNSLSPVLSVHFEAHSPTLVGKDLRQRNWHLQCGEREAVGGQTQTDEPYLGRACVSSPSTPACPGALAVYLFSLESTYTLVHVQTNKSTHTHIHMYSTIDLKYMHWMCTATDMHFCSQSLPHIYTLPAKPV